MQVTISKPRNPKTAKTLIFLKAEDMKALEGFLCCLPFGFVQSKGDYFIFPKDFENELKERILKNGWGL